MSEYLVILHDADPPTDQGRAQLQQELIAKLGIAEESVREMFESLPVILKENISRTHAEDFLRILESMGANVEILSSGEDTGAHQGISGTPETPLMQISDDSAFSLALDSAVENVEIANESIEDLEQLLNSMLGESSRNESDATSPSAGSATPATPEFFIEQEERIDTETNGSDKNAMIGSLDAEPTEITKSGLAFVIDAEGSESDHQELAADDSAEPNGPTIAELDRMLNLELGLESDTETVDATVDALSQPSSSSDSGASSGLSTAGNSTATVDLERLLDDALASVEFADASPAATINTGLLFAMDGEESPIADAAEALAQLEQSSTVDSVATPAAAPAMSLDFTLDSALDERQPEESAFEAALLNNNPVMDEAADDPFSGLDLSNVPEAPAASHRPSSVSTIEGRKAEAQERKRQLQKQTEKEELAGAFADQDSGMGPAEDNEDSAEVVTPSLSEGGRFAGVNRQQLMIKCGVCLLFATLFLALAKPDLFFDSQPSGLQLSPEQVSAMLSKEKEQDEVQKRAEMIAAEPTIQRWASEQRLEDDSRVVIELLTNGSKILGFEFIFEGSQPPEITPEELVDGIDRPWVRKIHGKALSLAEVVERTTSKTTKKIFVAESPARANVSDLQGSSLFAVNVRVELSIEAESLVGTWRVKSDITPASSVEEAFFIKRVGRSSFELAINGEAELTPVTGRSPEVKDDLSATKKRSLTFKDPGEKKESTKRAKRSQKEADNEE